jgi:hypothetical protein
MSICTAEDPKQQEKCIYFVKSSYEYRCMHLTFNEYCDCLNAQMHSSG